MLQKTERLYHTIKHLRLKQLYYRAYYKFKPLIGKKSYRDVIPKTTELNWGASLQSKTSFAHNNSFTFLNLTKSFESIDWNYSGYGKLWTYNLTYFDFLNQEGFSMEEGLKLIDDFIKKEQTLKDALEPYPISLRGINWIKFLSKYGIHDDKINSCLYSHYQRLYDNLEYHLLGNHLLENGFSLLFGATFFDDQKFQKSASKILQEELTEQILDDGAHFELSPMYHQIMLHRLLDAINLLDRNTHSLGDLYNFLRHKATLMLGWLEAITFSSGDIPMVNDTAFGIAPTTKELFNYAEHLGLKWDRSVLKGSGYRKKTTDHYECFIDVGDIGPSYIPGHAHADTFNFELYVKGKPFIVDVGTSTYEKNQLRQRERGTASHNTVQVDDVDQSEVWSGFRVGRRAKVVSLEEREDGYIASHDGYKRLGIVHQRQFEFKREEIRIEDTLKGQSSNCKAIFHLHPSIAEVSVLANEIKCHQLDAKISFTGHNLELEKSHYNHAEGFNKTNEGIVFHISFSKNLTTSISFNQ